MTAINFANRNLAPRTKSNPQFIEDLELAMALVIFPRETLPNELGALLNPDLRQQTADAVNFAILKSQNAGAPSIIGELLKARQWGEQKCREMKKPIPNRIYLGIEKEKLDEEDGDVEMKNGDDGIGSAVATAIAT
jgi:CTLH/CRA C-terminal to LisH motif domain